MARLFDDAASEYLHYAGAPVTEPPFTMSCWAYSDADGVNNQTAFALGRSATPYEGYQITFQTNVANDRIRFAAYGGVDENFYDDIASVWTVDTWYHLAFVVATRSSRTGYVNYSNYHQSTDTETIAALDQTRISSRGFATATQYLSGGVAEAALWNVALTAAEVAILAKGYSPLFVRPESLVFYAPLIRDEDRDVVSGVALTAYNTPTIAAHPRVIYPKGISIGISTAGAPPAATVIPALMRYYRTLRV